MKQKQDEYSPAETRRRFDAIMRGAMNKPTKLKDIPKTREKRPAKSRSPKR